MGFLNNLLKPNAGVIGVDLGSATLKMAQVSLQDDAPHLMAAACREIPEDLRAEPRQRIDFCMEAIPQLLSESDFRGRRVLLGLPASLLHLERLRLPSLDEQGMKQAIMYECAGKLPFHPSRALIRHLLAGEVYEDNQPMSEVIVLAARRELTDRFLNAAAKAKLEVAGVSAEPLAIANCFASGEGASAARAFIDIGMSSTRMYVAVGSKIQFARAVSIGADQFDLAVAQQLRVNVVEARKQRLWAANQQPSAKTGATTTAGEAWQQVQRIEQACHGPLRKLVEELELSLRYHGATFSATPVDRIVFLGAAAAHRRLCQKIAVELNLPAQAADPLEGLTVAESLTRGTNDAAPPPPAWTVAIGLSLGALERAAAKAA